MYRVVTFQSKVEFNMNILQEKSLWNEFQNCKSRHDIYALKDSWFVHFLDLTHLLDLLGNRLKNSSFHKYCKTLRKFYEHTTFSFNVDSGEERIWATKISVVIFYPIIYLSPTQSKMFRLNKNLYNSSVEFPQKVLCKFWNWMCIEF